MLEASQACLVFTLVWSSRKAKQALCWIPHGKGNLGRPPWSTTWRDTVWRDIECMDIGYDMGRRLCQGNRHRRMELMDRPMCKSQERL